MKYLVAVKNLGIYVFKTKRDVNSFIKELKKRNLEYAVSEG